MPPNKSRWDILNDKEGASIKVNHVEATDHCQSCGVYRDALILPENRGWLPEGGDPLIRVELEMRSGQDALRLGPLLLCPWCANAFKCHFLDPFLEKHHQPLQRKLDRIQGILNGTEEDETF